MLPGRLIWIRLGFHVAAAAVCCLALQGCAPKAGHNLNTEIIPTTVKDVSKDPIAALAAIHELGKTKEERDDILAAYQNLWMQNVDVVSKQSQLQAEIRAKEVQRQGEQDRANAAEAAQQKLDRTWMFVLLGVGVLSIAAAGAITYFGWSMPNVPSGKFAIAVAVIGFLFIIMAPNARLFAPGLKIAGFAILGTIVVSLLSLAAKGIVNTWRGKLNPGAEPSS